MTIGVDRPVSGPRVRVVRRWEAKAFETDGVTPSHAASAVILWEGFPDVDGGVPARLALPLAVALTTLGEVCFRVGDRPLANMRRLGTVAASRWPFARSWDVVGTRDGIAATALFEWGWAQGDQVAVVAPSGDERAMAMLAAKHLGGTVLTGAELVAAAIVDGAGMLVAAADRARLDGAVDLILERCADESIAQAPGEW